MSAAALTKPTSNSKSEASIATTIGCASDEYRDLEGAFGRRALTERAKGILTECHSNDEVSAFEMLRHQSKVSNRKLIDLAAAVVDGHRLLQKQPPTPQSS